tara:strand:- start:346 stop:795 length:450 start_codon:yes stop_codon:yes gene_type:complete
MTDHNKYYYESGRNGWTPSNTWQDEVIKDKQNKWDGGKINPKMLLNKEEIMTEYRRRKSKLPTDTKFEWHLDKVVEKIVKLLKEKNSAYGDTALNPVGIFSKLDSAEAICARLDDKLSRIKNRGINDKTEDTIDDVIGYLLLLKMSMER